jgi:hypothetical protein
MVICLAVGFFVGRKEEIIMKEKKLIKEGQKGKHSQRTREVVQDSTKSAETSCKEETIMKPLEKKRLTPEEAIGNTTPSEIIAMMQKEFPHLNPQLGRADDPELSEMQISFAPRSMRSKKRKPGKETKPTIYYRISPANEALVFAWQERAEYVSRIHNALEAKTWGELKKKLPPEEYDSIIDARSDDDSYGEKPRIKSSDPFEAYDDVPGYGDGDYPDSLQQEMEYCLPDEILHKYATRDWTTFNGDYYRIEIEHEEAVCKDLKALGFNVIRRDDIYFY